METSNTEHIYPAINYAETDMNNQLSSEEFQTKLYYWFNQKGIVSNMRSYLRMKMINALKSTAMGESTKTHVNVHVEDQAFNILIADYLFQHGYDYSLSVFSTEIPIKTLVSEFCFFLFNKEKSQYRHKIDEENVLSVIELLGINGKSELAREILQTYRQSDKGSLLFWILKIVMNYYKPSDSSSEEGNMDGIGRVIKKTLIHFNLPSTVINHMIDKINAIVKKHIKTIIEDINKKHDQENFVLRAEYKNKENEFKEKLVQVEKYLNEETKKIEVEHRKLVYLTECMVTSEKKLSEKSRQMENKLKKINELEVKLTETLQSKNKTNNNNCQLPHLEESCNLIHCHQQCEENFKEIERLRLQKSDFEKIVENQNTLIVNLTTKTEIMYKQAQDSMITIENLKQQLEKQQILLNMERRIREQISDKTITSSEAPTIGTDGEGDHNAEDAIKESHFKLEQLEKESKEIEQKFRRFKLQRHT